MPKMQPVRKLSILLRFMQRITQVWMSLLSLGAKSGCWTLEWRWCRRQWRACEVCWGMEHFGRRRWTTILAPLVSCSVHEGKTIVSAVKYYFLSWLGTMGACMVVHLLLLKFLMVRPFVGAVLNDHLNSRRKILRLREKKLASKKWWLIGGGPCWVFGCFFSSTKIRLRNLQFIILGFSHH